MRWLIPLLLFLAVPAFAEPPQHVFFPGPISGTTSGLTGTFQNLIVGPGQISITGTGSGTDQITGIANLNGFLYANNFPGADIGAKVNAAMTSLGAGGGTIMIPPGTYPFTTTIQCPIAADLPIIIAGAGSSSDYNFAGTTLVYTGPGDAVNQLMTSGHQNSRGCELRDLTLDGGSAPATAVGFHFGGTIYSKTQDVMIRDFAGSCIELENTPDPTINGHWTERYDFHQTYFSECGTEVYFHNNTGGGNNSFMHGKMDIHAGMFSAQNGIVIDGDGEATGCDFEINGNMAPGSTGALIQLVNGSYLFGKMTLLPECMNSTPCTRFNIDATSHFNGQIFGGIPGPFTDVLAPGADFQAAYADSRFIAPIHSSCLGIYGLNPNQTADMFTITNYGTEAGGLLSIGSYYTGNETVSVYGLAGSSCSSNTSTGLIHTTQYAGGAPFTITETCHPAAAPPWPAGSTTYSVTNNAPQPVTLSFSFLNTLLDPRGAVLGPQAEVCF